MAFGTACKLNLSSTNTAILTVAQGKMLLNTTYAFTVVVLSKDKPTDSQTVIVSPSDGTAQQSITSTFTRFNPSAKLVLDATISADYPVIYTWSVFTVFGAPVNVPSLTLKSILFPGSSALNAISFPFSVQGEIFSPGKTYTFQLTASSTRDAANIAFSQITLTANLAPTSGHIVSSPTNGTALVTQFTVSSPGWTADAASFPLTYAFSYRMFNTSADLTLAVSSLRSYTTTMLPAGVIVLQTQVTDIYLTLATATTIVKVTSASAPHLSQIFNTLFDTSLAVGNINLAIQTVNNVSIPHLSEPSISAVS